MYKLTFFVPESNLGSVKDALFKIGAGKIGDYDCCCFQVKGQGQFKPLAGSNPHLGELNTIEVVEEYRVEMVVDQKLAAIAIETLLESHPYETPAYELQEFLTLEDIKP